ncbi:PREDICTED: esterase E4-like [Dufourea novaeangliae]|uniref:Carboxylic ester hydrolase n=1 Tax=Dufourea novaeangliae TaxID=178035 RepID=A0A154P7P8_DUFNO|nr:PREDICTED: esterase E4-like [Dufourea novaeangliae]KZC07956.1 Esterase FE4 [Dufourea novaeangliae]
MKIVLVVFSCVVGIIASPNCPSDQPLVNAPIGPIRGSIIPSRQGRKIYSFRGVRYGESPTGHQRFQPPIPAEDWRDVFDATEEGPSCPYPRAKLISEDCLRLNVYTSKLPCENENVSRPVMVFLHPGGFYSYSGQSSLWGPQYIIDKDIVLVTVNYRLGALGFLSTGDHLAPGNNGLKDQVVALRWVQRNIAAFGGNPNAVTLCGYSAGSFSIMLHMMSPMSKDLFHRAITMSATPISADLYGAISSTGQKDLAKKQAEALDCPTDTTGSMLLCLNTKPVENFTDTLSSLFEWHGNPILLFKPTVEREVRGVERFLTAQPYDLIKQGKFHQVPLILGVTKDEFGGVAAAYEKDFRNNGTLYQELNDNWNHLAPIILQYERGTPRTDYVSRELRRFYFNDQPINSATNKELSEIYADGIIIFPMYRTAKLFATYSKKPVYFYKFTFQSRYSFSMWNDTTPFGVVHHDDLQFLFFMKQIFQYFESDAPEIPMVEKYTTMWTNFVQTGEPIPKNDEKFKGVTWTTLVPSRNNYLEINLNPTMKTDFYPERMRTWERLFPLPTKSHNVKH